MGIYLANNRAAISAGTFDGLSMSMGCDDTPAGTLSRSTVIHSAGAPSAPIPPSRDSSRNSSHAPPQPPAVVATVLPKPQDINLKVMRGFDGSSEELSLFDAQVRSTLKGLVIPILWVLCTSDR